MPDASIVDVSHNQTGSENMGSLNYCRTYGRHEFISARTLERRQVVRYFFIARNSWDIVTNKPDNRLGFFRLFLTYVRDDPEFANWLVQRFAFDSH